MTKNDIIIALVREHFSFTFDGDSEANRTIIFTKQGFKSTPILLSSLTEGDIEKVKSEYSK